MKIFFDTEFYEDGKTIDLMSIGMVREDDQMLYLVNKDCDWTRVFQDGWHLENTLPNILGSPDQNITYEVVHRARMQKLILDFVGMPHIDTGKHSDLEFWAYYAAYDWVVLCQLFGRMMDLPEGWPMYCNDLKQSLAACPDYVNSEESDTHNALDDAVWLRDECKRFFDWQVAEIVRISNEDTMIASGRKTELQ